MVRAQVTRLQSDHLLRNSFFILLSTVTTGAVGFLFWTVVARSFSADDVGLGSTLVTASSLIAYSSLLGFNQTFVRSLPGSDHRDALINTGLLMVLGAGIVLAVAYILVVPVFVTELEDVRSRPLYALGFVLLSAFTAANLATDAVFLAYRSALYNFVIDGLVQGAAKLALPLALVSLGAYGIFLASGAAAVVAVAVSIALLVRRFGYRPRWQISRIVVRREVGFSAATYSAHLLDMAPVLLVPIIVITTRGPADAAYFFIAFQIANMLYAVTYAVSQSMFVEGSYDRQGLRRLARRSLVLQAKVVPAGSVGLALLAPLILGIVGADYRGNGTAALIVLALSAPVVAVNTWTVSLLKLTGQLRVLIIASVIHAGVICGLAALWSGRGLMWVALAWLVGNLMSGVVACAALVLRHR